MVATNYSTVANIKMHKPPNLNYFAFYDLPVSFFLDPKELKRRFLTYSKQYHPDFYVHDSAEEQERVLELATLNNKAYKTLKDFDLRMQYILKQQGVMEEGERYKLSPMFLMEMMELNEQLMELEFEADANSLVKVEDEVKTIENQLFEEVKPIFASFDQGVPDTDLKKVKDFFYKKRYLLRIKESLNKFAAS